jgi:hypothetical protein
MAVQQGNKITLHYKAEASNDASDITSLTSYNDVEGVTSVSISMSNATYEVDFKDVTQVGAAGDAPQLTATRAYAVGTTSANLSVEGVYDPTLTDNAEELFDLCKNKTRIGIFFANANNGDKIGGVGFCNSFDLSGGVNDFVTFSASFELTGDPTIFS